MNYNAILTALEMTTSSSTQTPTHDVFHAHRQMERWDLDTPSIVVLYSTLFALEECLMRDRYLTQHKIRHGGFATIWIPASL